jgi:two-component system, chemotaxis family, response regulator Rcp1
MLGRQLSPLKLLAWTGGQVPVWRLVPPNYLPVLVSVQMARRHGAKNLVQNIDLREHYVQSMHWAAGPSAARITEQCMTGRIGSGGRPIEVLLVEDSPGDVRLTQEAFRDANGAIKLHVACDGVEAMRFLRREGGHSQSPRPDLILLDLNLPRMDGREVLAHIKDDDDLKTIPTVILTTSESEADIVKSYQLQANCYLCKPVQLEAFEALVKSINDFWLTTVHLPSKKTAA